MDVGGGGLVFGEGDGTVECAADSGDAQGSVLGVGVVGEEGGSGDLQGTAFS